MPNDSMQDVFQFARERAIEEYNNLPWYQQNPDISIPLLFICVGLFQFIVRKWLLPVSNDIIDKLEDQAPLQGLFYNPAFGVAIIIFGVILLVIFNLEKFF